MSKWQWLFTQLSHQLGFRISLFAILGVLSALVAIVLKPFIPASIGGIVGEQAVDNILTILASSMLAVTTFSLSTMVTAYGSAATSVTPRATLLMREDSITQNVLATFMGAFLFSLVGIIARSMGVYGERGRVVLFVATLVVVAVVIIMLVRWIQHLAQLGRVNETTLRVEQATHDALSNRVAVPWMGGNPWVDPPEGAIAVYPEEIGYIQNVDVSSLNELAEESGSQLYLNYQAGAFVHPALVVVWLVPGQPDVDLRDILDAITINAERAFEQDPRFGFAVLAEIASRALSPAVNDPGTAIDVIGRSVRLLALWGTKPAENSEVIHPRIYVKSILTADLFDDIFNPIARDGASLLEVQMRLAKSLKALADLNPETFAEDARRYLGVIESWCDMKMELPENRQRLKEYIRETGLNRKQA